MKKSGLYKAPKIYNYPGFPVISGAELLEKLAAHAQDAGAELKSGQVTSIMPGSVFQVGYGAEILSSKCVILATGVIQQSTIPGEAELLGRGVSYCATCDGMFYRNKRICVVCLTPEAYAEADYLSSVGCEVVRLDTPDVIINGETRVKSVTVNGEDIECSGVFILRREIAPDLLLSGLVTSGGLISVAASGKTNIPGVFAAGDCTGSPYQIAKAVGEGQIASLSASEYARNIITGE